ncbi:MAG: nucleoside-diphosphate-sugar epimerase [Parcubacteria group bacterium Gr01-1014_48]|nr:MAG: nucleoside-diphosphate-sugar epimerase [Parcubacteria group bacterium Greene0416_14]TSC74487.1 MAG: nucleoside-diphosphate-sugar epimerase [Parcubacteria group bacterium Gr01-1014_48]TSD00345.1 MAG: nucleoside-diphosphate-sugar epimerase [Parcubacteria group bacterium Greene1014_15]TSD07756.1 MAG: nucleoside-diphosphate-sugar epimerase [Parcubacteria group bacterium Greene0714_4]
MRQKILITGGAGFIGYHLARYLLGTTTAKIVLVDNLFRGRMDGALKELLKNHRVTFLNLDLTDARAYLRLGSGYDHVYHLAAVNGTGIFYDMPHEVMRINTATVLYFLEWFRKKNSCGKILFTSSNEAYAGGLSSFGQLPIPTPENVPLVIADTYNPRWTYAGTKALGELFMIHCAQMYKFRGVIVRPHNFYGPRAGYNHVIPELSLRIAARVEPFPIYGATDTRSFCYIDDAVRAMVLLMESTKTDGLPIETVHIGVNEETPIRDLAEKLFEVAGWKPKKLQIHDAPQGSVARRLGDVQKIKNLVGWVGEVSLHEGLKRTYEWYAEHPDTAMKGEKIKVFV